MLADGTAGLNELLFQFPILGNIFITRLIMVGGEMGEIRMVVRKRAELGFHLPQCCSVGWWKSEVG